MSLFCGKISFRLRVFQTVSRRANLPQFSFPRLCRTLVLACIACLIALAAPPTRAQQSSAAQPANSLADGRGSWEFGAFLGGGTGAGKSSDTQFLFAGGRAGRVLTPDLFSSTPIRGNLEYGIEIMP